MTLPLTRSAGKDQSVPFFGMMGLEQRNNQILQTGTAVRIVYGDDNIRLNRRKTVWLIHHAHLVESILNSELKDAGKLLAEEKKTVPENNLRERLLSVNKF